ncbi:glycosyltransferase family 2 protein [Paucilactobacillus kaifaensis]|uniref:glycosyltransferase family 2 protein n=1 Tax=Paucilactobacillus kaifaensis TaxID=2559921 RepID=UPI0010F5B6A7|nr:glycosyltransferase family 2 protein [Paucilactobacillus kaifaensis]
MNLVSVILPVKNNAVVLPDLLTDLKSQHYKNFEVIFVDNNSVDQTYQQLVAFKRLSGIKTTIISQRIRQSVATSYNQALTHAQGRYVMFLTAKMRLHPMWLSQVSQTAVVNQTDIVGYNGQNQHFNSATDLITSYLLGQTPMNIEGMLIKRQLTRSISFDPKLSLHAGTLFLYNIYQRATSATFLGGKVQPELKHSKNTFKAEHLQVVTVLDSIDQCIQQNYPTLSNYAWRHKHQTLTDLYHQIKQLPMTNRRIFKTELVKIKAELRTIEFKQFEFSNIKRFKSWLNRRFNRHMTIYPESKNKNISF